ncbi:MAG: metallophosphoesterase [Candidatus Eisenbacteria sp.]|nr:metallophosphoesterase [Candidatus Eisenbacteria bacterium]
MSARFDRHRPGLRAMAFTGLILVSGPAAQGSDLSGALSGYLPAGTYRIVDDIEVPDGETLTLAPGVVFQFEDSFWEEYEFDVHGTLHAEGTSGQPIVFQAASGAEEYNYLRIASSTSRLRHCIIEDAGKVSILDQGGLWIDNCSPVIEDCTVRNGSWHGIYITGSSACPTIRTTGIANNSGDGIDGDDGAGMTVINCRLTGNGGDGVCVAGGANTIIGTLIARNGENGVDSHGTADYAALLINCTIADHPSGNLSDCSLMDLYNCIAVGQTSSVERCEHSLFVSDAAYYHFVDYAAGDLRLAHDSPARNYGTRFGPPAGWLPAEDLAGESRIQGIVDAGAYESAGLPELGEEGPYFSRALIAPRMTQPVFRTPEESFPALVGLLGDYTAGEAWAQLVDPLGNVWPLTVLALSAHDLTPGSDLAVQLFAPGLERIQELSLQIPIGTPAGLCDIRLGIGEREFYSLHAVRVLTTYRQTWRFIHITDPHIGYDAEAFSAALRLRIFTREANFLQPDLVVLTGDICDNQDPGTEAFVDSLLEAVALLRVPILIQPGNHDHYNNGSNGGYDPGYPLRYFERINRYRNCHLELGGAHFFAFNTGDDLGLLELYRCRGPESPALDWAESILIGLAPLADRPRFFLMHGPNYDYFTWNSENVGRVRDLMNAHAISLCLCGHTHRFETFLNSGENYLGRDDFKHVDDWGRDVAFPDYPLHVQTSSLGKEEHLSAEKAALATGAGDQGSLEKEILPGAPPDQRRRGLFGDDIGWRYVQVVDGQVEFFTADTDGDGYRNTEAPWPLGDLEFLRDEQPAGVIVATVLNHHHETWHDVHHLIPADPEITYQAQGGALQCRYPDGTVEVAVDSVAAGASSVVVLTPASSSAPIAGTIAPSILSLTPTPTPTRGPVDLEIRWAGATGYPTTLHVFDAQGRCVRDLSGALDDQGGTFGNQRGTLGKQGAARGGISLVTWDGRDDRGRRLGPGIYYIQVRGAGARTVSRMVILS